MIHDLFSQIGQLSIIRINIDYIAKFIIFQTSTRKHRILIKFNKITPSFVIVQHEKKNNKLKRETSLIKRKSKIVRRIKSIIKRKNTTICFVGDNIPNSTQKLIEIALTPV